MAIWMYKTRGNSSPQGKPKVYFCCHPDESAAFLDAVSDELLQKQNCAVWYPEDPHAARDEAMLEDLKTMQLFVIPVTRTLLTSHNPAMDIEFPFATAHHIPVLPLMQESGLDELFNRRFGDLQYLSRFIDDPTAISYDEKLATFLATVLIGDELGERIRAAFDAYVFLSYRKKDRRYAQELMRLIHSHDFARDIAIWYDEFLTPGEDFSDAIRKALRDSQLFVLAVTPNLTEPANYVMTTEYPMARKEGKCVLPAEMCPTDRDTLENTFEALPACTDAHDGTALSDALLSALRTVACRENDTPMHDFFIGLAYLSGVDVEVDHERALALITSAADRGLSEALDKLVDMYRNGIGVERNYRTAIDWLIKKAALAQTRYKKKPNDDTATGFIVCCYACGDALCEIADLEEAMPWYRRGTALAEQFINQAPRGIRRLFAKKTDNTVMRHNLAVGYECLGNVAEMQGDLNSAENYYQQALTISLALAEESKTVRMYRSLLSSYNHLGCIAKLKGDFERAETYYRQELKLALTIAKQTNTVQTRLDLAICCGDLGSVLQEKGDIDGAVHWYQQELELTLAIVQETGTVAARRCLASCYDRHGEIAQEMNDLNTAEEYYEKELAITLALAEETETVDARRNLSVSYQKLGIVARDRGDRQKAVTQFEKALSLRRILADEAQTAESLDDLATTLYYLSTVCSGENQTQHLREALHLFSLLSERYPQISSYPERRDFVQDILDDL